MARRKPLTPDAPAALAAAKAAERQRRLDEFARAVLTAGIDRAIAAKNPHDSIARHAYAIAEAMLAESDRRAAAGEGVKP